MFMDLRGDVIQEDGKKWSQEADRCQEVHVSFLLHSFSPHSPLSYGGRDRTLHAIDNNNQN